MYEYDVCGGVTEERRKKRQVKWYLRLFIVTPNMHFNDKRNSRLWIIDVCYVRCTMYVSVSYGYRAKNSITWSMEKRHVAFLHMFSAVPFDFFLWNIYSLLVCCIAPSMRDTHAPCVSGANYINHFEERARGRFRRECTQYIKCVFDYIILLMIMFIHAANKVS